MTEIKDATNDLIGGAYTGSEDDKIIYAWQVTLTLPNILSAPCVLIITLSFPLGPQLIRWELEKVLVVLYG